MKKVLVTLLITLALVGCSNNVEEKEIEWVNLSVSSDVYTVPDEVYAAYTLYAMRIDVLEGEDVGELEEDIESLLSANGFGDVTVMQLSSSVSIWADFGNQPKCLDVLKKVYGERVKPSHDVLFYIHTTPDTVDKNFDATNLPGYESDGLHAEWTYYRYTFRCKPSEFVEVRDTAVKALVDADIRILDVYGVDVSKLYE